MRRITLCASLAVLLTGWSVSSARAQEKPAQEQQQKQEQQKQKPATQKPKDTRVAPPEGPLPPLSTEKTKGEAAAPEPTAPASTEPASKPLTGVEQYTLSTMGRGHSYFYPEFQVAQSGDTNSGTRYGSSNFESVSTISGSFNLNHVWSHYNFGANYAGSGFIYNQDPSASSSAHAFSIAQRIQGKRSSLLLTDAVSYLPEAAFGFARFGGFSDYGAGGLFGVNTSNLSGVYVPNQSILTGHSSRISNSVAAEYDYALSPLSSVTFTGSYGLLRFPDTGFIDSNAGIFGVGYNHSFTRRDSVAINYTGTVFRYDQSSNDFNNHIVALMYGHQISHLLRLQLGGGPQVNTFNSAVNRDTMVSWYATASLDYQLPRTRISMWYTHYTTGGSGVFLGAQTDNLSLSFDRQLTRMWSGDLSFGYSYNKNLQSASASQTFNSWYASANLRRPVGHYMDLFLSYNLQQQSSNNPFCTGGGCGSFYTRNYFSLGFSWHPRSIELGGTD